MANFTYKPTSFFRPKAHGGLMAYSKKDVYCTWKKGCGQILTKAQADYSIQKYGRALCWGHQKQLDRGYSEGGD